MKLTHLLLVAVLGAGACVTTAYAGDYIENQVYQDPNYHTNLKRAEAILIQKGYTISDLDVDDWRGKPIFDIEAWKGNAKYDIKMSYPDLRIISERRDWDWD